LLDACRTADTIELLGGRPVARYEQNPTGVTVATDGGERFTGTALIGADGICSAVRRQLVGDGKPWISGHTTYRSVILMERVPNELRWNTVTLRAGPDGIRPLSDRQRQVFESGSDPG
jgi:salicylate hydroxylase